MGMMLFECVSACMRVSRMHVCVSRVAHLAMHHRACCRPRLQVHSSEAGVICVTMDFAVGNVTLFVI